MENGFLIFFLFFVNRLFFAQRKFDRRFNNQKYYKKFY